MDILKQINKLRTELDALRPIDKEQEAVIMQKFRLDWNYHSNHLEGNALTYGETKALLLFNITAQGKPLQDHIEMTGHNEAIKWIEEVLTQERPLDQAFIRNLHQLILKESYEVDAITPEGNPTKKKVIVGDYKKTPNHIKTVTGEIFRFASPEETPGKMSDLVDWYRQEKETNKHSLLLAAEFHYKFIRIHPFDDGNGRTARILMNFILMQQGYPPVVIKTEDKENYFAALRQADVGIIEPFIKYIGRNLIHSLDMMIKGAKGESIDEPDDVDKEVALIKQRMKQLDKVEDNSKSKEVIIRLFDQVLFSIVERYIYSSEKYNQLYHKSTVSFSINSISVQLDLNNLLDSFIKELFKFDHIDRIHVDYEHKSLKGKGLTNIKYNTALNINFNPDNYSINFNSLPYGNREGIIKQYNQELSEKEIKNGIRTLTKSHSDYLNKYLEKKSYKQ